MGKYVSESSPDFKKVYDAFHSKDRVVVGEMEGCRETKWAGWCVLFVDGRLFACVVGPRGEFSCAEEIVRDELALHVDDEEAAAAKADALLAALKEVKP